MADQETIVLEATKRTIKGKQVKQLRAQGVVPGVLYGPTFDPVWVQMKWTDLRAVLRAAGGSHLIVLDVDNEQHNALVREVQRDPIRGDVLHVDFYRVRMDVVFRAEVPVVTIGSEDEIASVGGMVIHEMTAVTVECLPGDLPAQVAVDISLIKAIGDRILARDLPVLPGVRYLVGEDDVVVSSVYAARPEEEEEVEEVEAVISAEPELIRRHEEEEDEEV
jgi:large subunit ribosomal protein L25